MKYNVQTLSGEIGQGFQFSGIVDRQIGEWLIVFIKDLGSIDLYNNENAIRLIIYSNTLQCNTVPDSE